MGKVLEQILLFLGYKNKTCKKLRLFSIPCWLSHTEILLCISFAINREIYGKSSTMSGNKMGQGLFAETVASSGCFHGDFNHHVHEQYECNEF